MKKLVCLLLSLSFIITMLASCKQSKKTNSDLTTDKTETTTKIEQSSSAEQTSKTSESSESSFSTIGSTSETTSEEISSESEYYGRIEQDQEFTYRLVNDKFYELFGVVNPERKTTLTVPAEFNGRPVKRIKGSSGSDGTTAFSLCSNVQKITISDGIESIGKDAFVNCMSLLSVNIPKSVKYIGDDAFGLIDNLVSIKVDDNNPKYMTKSGVLFTKDGKNLIKYPPKKTGTSYTVPDGVKVIKKTAFTSNSFLTSVKLPDGLEIIEWGAFASTSNLVSINIPNSLKEIELYAFMESGITSINIPKDTLLGEGVLSFTANLEQITVDNKNEKYKTVDGVLYSKDGKVVIQYPAKKQGESFDIPNGVEEISMGAFSRSNLKIITIPDSVEIIKHYAFYKSSITSVVIPDGIKKINNSAFGLCQNLKTVKLPSSLEVIDYGAFNECSSLEEIIIPNKVEQINSLAFYRCISLTTLVIPDSVTNIGMGAFYLCKSLESVIIPENVEVLESYAFFECNKLTIYCKASSEPQGWGLDWNSSRPVVWGYTEEE